MGIIIVYDVTDRRSFDNIPNWIKQVEEHTTNGVDKLLVGNKCDAQGERRVSQEEGRRLANDYGLSFLETSAKSNINVEEAFYTLARMVKKRVIDPEQAAIADTPTSNVDLNNRRTDTSSGCC
jgi:Ras-related protein Rab-8A